MASCLRLKGIIHSQNRTITRIGYDGPVAWALELPIQSTAKKNADSAYDIGDQFIALATKDL